MFEVEIWNNKLIFDTDPSLFSPMSADRGTMAMLRTVGLKQDAQNVQDGQNNQNNQNAQHLLPDEKVLDLGCGYGIVGIAAAKVIGGNRVYMVDNNEKAVLLSRKNAVGNSVPDVTIVCGDGVSAFKDVDFSLILCNPPYHTDFSVAKAFIEQGFRSLKQGGRMIMVVKRLDWYRNKLTAVFGGVRTVEDDGYFILTSEKRSKEKHSNTVKRVKIRKTTAKHEKKMMRSAEKFSAAEKHEISR